MKIIISKIIWDQFAYTHYTNKAARISVNGLLKWTCKQLFQLFHICQVIWILNIYFTILAVKSFLQLLHETLFNSAPYLGDNLKVTDRL